MASSPESSNSATRPISHIRARNGNITEVIGDVIYSLPSMFRLWPDEASFSSSEKLMQMISKITVKDVEGAKRCGKGGFSAVFMLEHPTKGKVALKQLRVAGVQGGDDLRRRTLREGDTWQDLNHPCVLPFLGILETPTDLYLISPYVGNGSLDEYLRQHPDVDRRAFLQETAAAIAYLHKCGIIHGDIKAANILVSDDIHALLCDFGLARSETTVTSMGLEGAGTMRFQSPELLTKGGRKAFTSDAWAFGMTIYQVLSGNVPFHEYNDAGTICAIMIRDERPPKSPAQSPLGHSYDSVWDVADGCWEKDPALRLSMQDAHKRLCPSLMVLQGHTKATRDLELSPDRTTIVSASDNRTIQLGDVKLRSQRVAAWNLVASSITLKNIQGAKPFGRGESGAVLMLEHATKGKLALKQVHVSGVQGGEDLRRHTLREGETWQDLNHPCVLPFMGILETPTDLYLVSPYIENGSLDRYLHEHPYANREGFLQQASGAIAYLHGRGIVHGDIKATNILVSNNIQALICDFGLTRSDTTVTSVGLDGVGTIRFQAPELLTRGGGKTFASDTWAFGMTIYEACHVLSGKIPFHEHNATAMINAIANKDELPPKSPTHSPSGRSYEHVWNVASACWEKDPTRRLSMQDAHQRLRPNLMVLKGHTGHVHSVAFSPDGTTMVSASGDRTIRLWDMESGSKRSEVWKGHSNSVTGVAFSPDGRTVMSSSRDQSIRLWDVELGGQLGGAWKGHTARVGGVVFSPDGKTVASASDDRTLRLWNAESGVQQGGALTGHTEPVGCLAFSPDGRTIVSGSRDNTIRLWDVEARSQQGDAWKGHTYWVHGVAFSPDGRTVVSGSGDGTIRLWDVESGCQVGGVPKAHAGLSVRCIAFSPDGRTIVSGSLDSTIQLWDVESCTPRGEARKGHTHWVNSVAFSPDGRLVASASDDCTIRLWDI